MPTYDGSGRMTAAEIARAYGDFDQLRADIAKAAEQGLTYYAPGRTGPSLNAWRQADPAQLAEHLAVLITAGIAPALDRHTHRVVLGTLKELQRPANCYMRLRDPDADQAAFWLPEQAAVAQAMEMLAKYPDDVCAAIPMVQPGKAYGVWTSGQEVITVRPAVFLGSSNPVRLPAGASAPPWSMAVMQACATARAALASQPGTVAYAVVYRDGRAEVFESLTGEAQSAS